MIQLDHSVRVVAVANLRAICERVSGKVHRYWVEKVTRSRVWVGYSNPDEEGGEHPMFAIFPCYPNGAAGDNGHENLVVAFDFLRVVNDAWDGEGCQAFLPVTDCVQLFRDPVTEQWVVKPQVKVLLP